MKTTLVSTIDYTKTYVEAVHRPAIIIDSSCTDEGYFNITTETTSDANSLQSIQETVYPSASSITITEMGRPLPKHIHVHVTDKDENMTERNNRHRQLNINRNPAPSSVVVSKKKTLIKGDSILNGINTRGVCLFVLLLYVQSQVNSYGHGGMVTSPYHTFSWASLNKQFTSTSRTYFRL